jgi:spermidine synthase
MLIGQRRRPSTGAIVPLTVPALSGDDLIKLLDMSEKKTFEPVHLTAAPRFLPLLLLLFAASGCSALIYEIVWFQLLQLVIGSSAVSLAVLLGTYMGGMCLGSLLLPRLISARHHPLRVYAGLELALAIIGITVLFAMPYLGDVYTKAAGNGFSGILGRGLVCAACLLLPTVLMGATLPAIARWTESTPQGVAWLGFFYGGNIAGAVFGCLLAGFYLLRVHDMATATYVAAASNATVGLLGLAIAAIAAHAERPAPEPPAAPAAWRRVWSVYLAIAISGACALGAEVVWTRQLSLMLGGTVYTFSIILAVFLIGLGIGSSVGAFLGRSSSRPAMLLAGCQVLLAAAIAWTAYISANSLPYWPINPYLSKSAWFTFQLDLVRCIYAILPATCLWGASFPLALAAAATEGQDHGRLVGGLYAANTVGAIVGAVGVSLFLLPEMGTQKAQQLLIGLSAAAALFVIVPSLWSMRLSSRRPVLLGMAGVLLLAGIVGAAAFLVRSVPGLPWELVAFGRCLATYEDDRTNVYMGEGLNASVAVTQNSVGTRYFHISGKTEASSDTQDMRLQRMLGHLPALFHPQPRSVLVVGFGAGVTAGSFLTYPGIEKIVICELEPLVPRAVASYFSKENYGVAEDPRVEIVYDDARHYVLTTSQTFDIITSDPIHPWVKGSATLYTKEYFELCRRRLNPGGLITQWVPLYESDGAVVKSELATFFEVFPHGTIWSNDQSGKGYDVVVLGHAEPLTIDADMLQERLDSRDHGAVRKSLEDVGFNTVVGLLMTYGGQARDLGPWLENAEINMDRNLRLQYLAGMQLNTHQNEPIFDEMLRYRKFPENLLVGSGWRSGAVRVALERSIAAQKKDSEP